MVGMNKKKERSQNAVSVKNRLFCAWGVLTVVQGPQIFLGMLKVISREISTFFSNLKYPEIIRK